MSLILEALRRSEAERRRGQTPDLLSDIVPASRTARAAPRNWSVIAALAAAAAITLFTVLWWLRSPVRPHSSTVVPTEPANAVAEVTSPAPSTRAPQSQPNLQPPAPVVLRPLKPPTRTASQKIPPVAAPALSPARGTAPATARDVESGPPSISAPLAVASTAPATESASAFASADVPLKLSDLSAEERQQLPALKVSMHMWAPDAGNRFAIIDGTRVNEGDRIGDALIEAIHQDSVVLSWRGRHIRLPIR